MPHRNNNNNTEDDSSVAAGGRVVTIPLTSLASSTPADPENSHAPPPPLPSLTTAFTADSSSTSAVNSGGTRTIEVTSISSDQLSSFAASPPSPSSATIVLSDDDTSQPKETPSSQEGDANEDEKPDFPKIVSKVDECEYLRVRVEAEKKLREELERKDKTELVELVKTFRGDINNLKKECTELAEQLDRLVRPSLIKKYPLSLRIDIRENNYRYSYKKKDKTETYTAKYAFLFKMVRQHKATIWQTSSKDLYASKVEIIEEKRAVIYHVNEEKSEIEFQPEPDVFVIYLVEANVDVKHSTNEIVYKKNETKQREKFICRPGYLIDKIWRHGKAVWPPKVDVEEGQKPPDPVYSHKVVIEQVDGRPNMRVFFHESEQPEDDDDDEMDPDYVIVRDPKNPNDFNFRASVPFPLPEELTPKLPHGQPEKPKPQPTQPGHTILKPDDYPPELKLYVVDPSDSNNSIQISRDSLVVACPRTDVYNYYIKPGEKCNSVKFDDKLVWKYDSATQGDNYPLKISYRYTRKLFVYLSVPFVYEKQENGQWICNPLNVTFFSIDQADNAKTVEINYRQYEVKDKKDTKDEYIFEFKPGIKCSEIRYRGNQVWKHDATKFQQNFPKIVGFLRDKMIAIVIGETRILVSLASPNAGQQPQQATPPAGGAQAGASAPTATAPNEEGSDASVKPTESGSAAATPAEEKAATKEDKADDTVKSEPVKTATIELDSDKAGENGATSGDKTETAAAEETKQADKASKAPEAAAKEAEVDSAKQPTPEATPEAKVEAETPTAQTPDLTVANAPASATTPEHTAPPAASEEKAKTEPPEIIADQTPPAPAAEERTTASEMPVAETKPAAEPSQEPESRTTSTKVEAQAPEAPPSAGPDASQTQGAGATTPAQTPATTVHKSPEEQQHTSITQPTSGTPAATPAPTQVIPPLSGRAPDLAPTDDMNVVDTARAAAAKAGAQAPAAPPAPAQTPAAGTPAHAAATAQPVAPGHAAQAASHPAAQQPAAQVAHKKQTHTAPQTPATASNGLVPPLQPGYQSAPAQPATPAGTAPAAQVAAPAQQQPTHVAAQAPATQQQVTTAAQQQQATTEKLVIVPFQLTNGSVAYYYMTVSQYQAILAAYGLTSAAQTPAAGQQAQVAPGTHQQTAQAAGQTAGAQHTAQAQLTAQQHNTSNSNTSNSNTSNSNTRYNSNNYDNNSYNSSNNISNSYSTRLISNHSNNTRPINSKSLMHISNSSKSSIINNLSSNNLQQLNSIQAPMMHIRRQGNRLMQPPKGLNLAVLQIVSLGMDNKLNQDLMVLFIHMLDHLMVMTCDLVQFVTWHMVKPITGLVFCVFGDCLGTRKLSDSNGATSTGNKPVDLNIKSDTKSTDKFDIKTDGQFLTYTTKEDHGFKLVKEDGVTIWEASDDTSYSSKVEVELMLNDCKAAIVYLNDDETKVFIRDGAGKPWTEFDTSKVNPKSINVDFPNNSHFYTNTLDNGVRTFEARKGFAFNGANKYVDNNKIPLWKTENESEYSSKIVNEGNKVTIHLSHGSTKVIEKGSDGKWPGESSGDSKSGSKESKPVKKNGVDVNLKSDNKTTKKFEYEKKGKIVTYTAIGNNAFKLVKDDKAQIWKETDSTKYSTKIEVDLMNEDGKAVTIHLGENKTRVFMKDSVNQPWKEIDTNKVNPKSVNIKYEHNSYIYSNKLDNNVRTFTAKRGFLFNHVRSVVNNEWVDIWKTEEEDQYSGKVEVEGDKVTIHKGDGIAKVFNKVDDDKWEEETPAPETSEPESIIEPATFELESEEDEIIITSSDQPAPGAGPSAAQRPVEQQHEEAPQLQSDSGDTRDTAAQKVPGLTPRRQPGEVSSLPKTSLHQILCNNLNAENILADLNSGLHVSDFKFVHMAMWSPTYGTVNISIPLLARPLFALVNTDDGWASQYIGEIESFNSSRSPQTA
ncbi:hypothetical protein MACJ_002382 [Theileria orientalis]|uniref:Uncharacterized protein n=1 Tax=Theileria orientalis TaxID=68886 RepID=A0A976QQI9_THEOR|nr:hypothetical protein MACJ_002382 [Theileria orientalis]